jgi:hypothetical protein
MSLLLLAAASSVTGWIPVNLTEFRAPYTNMMCSGERPDSGMVGLSFKHNQSESFLRLFRTLNGVTTELDGPVQSVSGKRLDQNRSDLKIATSADTQRAELIVHFKSSGMTGDLTWVQDGNTRQFSCLSYPAPPGMKD